MIPTVTQLDWVTVLEINYQDEKRLLVRLFLFLKVLIKNVIRLLCKSTYFNLQLKLPGIKILIYRS